jgi:hypothetical protein
MADLIPSLNSCLSRMTSGEKRFARRLTMWHQFFYSENSPDDMAKECADLILAEGEVGKKWLK